MIPASLSWIQNAPADLTACTIPVTVYENEISVELVIAARTVAILPLNDETLAAEETAGAEEEEEETDPEEFAEADESPAEDCAMEDSKTALLLEPSGGVTTSSSEQAEKATKNSPQYQRKRLFSWTLQYIFHA
ncbi:MAG TPA: hypothetical protein PK297_00820 [Spirochaetota bacterium]|nr:hypothetical protein [Spirochaetota bacterium]